MSKHDSAGRVSGVGGTHVADEMHAAGDAATGDRVGQRLDGLLGMLSHDLRTPLSAITGWLFLLESGKLDPEGQKRALSKIRASIEEQVRLIDDTLAISRGATGRLEMESAPLSVGVSLEAALDAFAPHAAAKGVEVERPLRPAGIAAGDRDALQRAIDLLLAHALQATPAAGRIRVSTDATSCEVRITITDAGAGYAGADLPWVLDPFGRPRDGTAHGPRGVERGLLLAQALVAAQGGRLAVISDGPGRGASFTIALPVANGSAHAPA